MSDQAEQSRLDWTSWPVDREIVMARVVDAGREIAFRAWSDPEQIVLWYGPNGFRNETHEIDVRPGGVWRFDMIVPDGTRFTNRIEFLRIEEFRLIEFTHGADIDMDPDRFRMLVTFDDQDNGKTVVTVRQLHPSSERRAIVIGFGAVEYGAQTWDRLADHVAAMSNDVDSGQ